MEDTLLSVRTETVIACAFLVSVEKTISFSNRKQSEQSSTFISVTTTVVRVQDGSLRVSLFRTCRPMQSISSPVASGWLATKETGLSNENCEKQVSDIL